MPGFSEEEAREAIGASLSWAESLRRLGYCSTGGNWRTLKKYAAIWGISTDHFDQLEARRRAAKVPRRPLKEVLVEGSSYSRKDVKRRLLEAGLKEPQCELCGQGDRWRGKPMSLILDHINGVRDDHRIENLRMVCPNCAATLDTHCGRRNKIVRDKQPCALQETLSAQVPDAALLLARLRISLGSLHNQRKAEAAASESRPTAVRAADRPPYEQLMEEIEATSYLAVGRKYGVSDNAVRKWVRFYERQREREAGEEAA